MSGTLASVTTCDVTPRGDRRCRNRPDTTTTRMTRGPMGTRVYDIASGRHAAPRSGARRPAQTGYRQGGNDMILHSEFR